MIEGETRLRNVLTSYRDEGRSIIQTVASVEADKYPVIADLYFGKALISKAVWARGFGSTVRR